MQILEVYASLRIFMQVYGSLREFMEDSGSLLKLIVCCRIGIVMNPALSFAMAWIYQAPSIFDGHS